MSKRVGGLDAVLTVLTELCEAMTVEGLAQSAGAETLLASAQRLGWLFGDLGRTNPADALHRQETFLIATI